MIQFKAIGIIHTPFVTSEGTPIQPVYAAGACGTVEVFAEYEAGLKDLDGFSHIFCCTISTAAKDSTYNLFRSWLLSLVGSLPLALPRGRMPLASPWSNW